MKTYYYNKKKHMNKVFILLLFLFTIFLLYIIPSSLADNKNEYPKFYGTTEINLKINDTFDPSSTIFRVYAHDYKDGDITSKIKLVSNNVNTSNAGTYYVKYSITDSDNNTTTLDVPVNVQNDTRSIKKTLYTAFEPEYLKKRSIQWTIGQDKQMLGVYLPSNKTIRVRQTNGSYNGKTKIVFYNNDVEQEGDVELNDKDWHNITTKNNDSILFAVTDSLNYKESYSDEISPIIEIDLSSFDFAGNDNTKIHSANYYYYKDGSAKANNFYTKWQANQDLVSVIEGESVTFLIPYTAINQIAKNDSDEWESFSSRCYSGYGSCDDDDFFDSYDDLLLYYRNVTNYFLAYTALSKGTLTDKVVIDNSTKKWFIKAAKNTNDPHDVLAFNGSEYLGQPIADNVSVFTYKNWVVYHELGHSFEGPKIEKLELYESANETLGYYIYKDIKGEYESSYWGTWDYVENKALNARLGIKETAIAQGITPSFRMLIDNVVRYNNINLNYLEPDVHNNNRTRTYFEINMYNAFEKSETLKKYYDTYYKYHAYNGNSTYTSYLGRSSNFDYKDTDRYNIYSTQDIYAIMMAEEYNKNIIPYLNSWYISLDKFVSKQTYDFDYPLMYYLRDLVGSDDIATTIKNNLGLEGIYSLVDNSKISGYGYSGNVRFNILSEKAIGNFKINIKSSSNVVKSFDATTLNTSHTFSTNLPVGIYEIEVISNDSNTDYFQSQAYIYSTKDTTNTFDINIFQQQYCFDKNDDTDESSRVVCYDTKKGNKVGELPEVERNGYFFRGWYTDKDGLYRPETKITENTKIGYDDTTIYYAIWESIIYDVEFNANGGVGTMNTINLDYDETRYLPDNKFTRDGYTFVGWNTKADGTGTSYTNKQQITNLASNDDEKVILYAQWSQDGYNISFEKNNGTGDMASIVVPIDEYISLPDNQFVREGYIFSGWNTKADGTGTSYTNKQSIYNIGGNGDIILLYAQWQPIHYYLNLSGNGGEGVMPVYSLIYDKSQSLSKNIFTKNGYTFVNWNTKADGTGVSIENEGAVLNLSNKNDDNIYLYAQWQPIEYFVIYNANGGIGTMENRQVTFEREFNLDNNLYTKENYNFVGWNTKADGSGTSYNNGELVSKLLNQSGSITLYAQWTINIFNIDVELNDGVIEGNIPTNYNVNSDNIVINNPTKDGYDFIGWNVNNAATLVKDYTIISGSTGNIKLKANWASNTVESNKYNIADKAINNIEVKTSVSKYLQNITTNSYHTYSVYTSKGNENTGYIGTGNITKIYYESKLVNQYVNIIKGDLTEDGQIRMNDIVKAANHIVGNLILEDYNLQASDVTNDGKLRMNDLVKMANFIVNK